MSLALTSPRINLDFSRNLAQMSYFVGSIGFLPYVTGQIIPDPSLRLGSQVLKLGDQGWLEHVTYGNLQRTYSNTVTVLALVQSNPLKVHFLSFFL